MKKILFIIIFFGSFDLVSAQDSMHISKQKIKFQSFEQGGLLAGENKSAFHVETINGINYKTFFGGIGVGIDNYIFRTIPIFLDLRTDMLNRQSTPFIFIDAGSQFQWVEDGQKPQFFYLANLKYKPRIYFNAGAGYKVSLTSKTALTFSAAYSLKSINESYNTICDFAPCPELPVINKYTLKRLALNAAITFW